MRRIEARRKNAKAFRLRHSQSLAKRRQRLSQAMVRSTIHRLGKTAKPPSKPKPIRPRLLPQTPMSFQIPNYIASKWLPELASWLHSNRRAFVLAKHHSSPSRAKLDGQSG